MRPTQAVLDWLLKVAPEFGASMTLQEVQEDTDVYLIPDDSITKALDQQARIGQCALVWKDGLPHFIGPDAPPPIEMRKPFK